MACSQYSINVSYYLQSGESLDNWFLRALPSLSSVIFLSYSASFPPSQEAAEKKENEWVSISFFLLLSSHSFQGTSNSWNGHRLTLWTTDFIFSSFYGLFFCDPKSWKLANVGRQYAHLKMSARCHCFKSKVDCPGISYQ